MVKFRMSADLQSGFIVESSQHFSINRLDLHICEESAQASAVQITLTEMSMDYYPARKAARSRKEFNPYTEAMMARDKWIESILQVGQSWVRVGQCFHK